MKKRTPYEHAQQNLTDLGVKILALRTERDELLATLAALRDAHEKFGRPLGTLNGSPASDAVATALINRAAGIEADPRAIAKAVAYTEKLPAYLAALAKGGAQ